MTVQPLNLKLIDIHHNKMCYSQNRMCAHPRQCPIGNYGHGEITVVHHHAPCNYQTGADVKHGQLGGYKARAKILLQRSLDHGQTWPRENEVVIWDDSLDLEEKRVILARSDDTKRSREKIDLSDHDASIYFSRPASGPPNDDGHPSLECYAFRSSDRGHTWETVPTRVSPPPGMNYVHIDGAGPVQFLDGSQLVVATSKAASGSWALGVYGTDDQGLTWKQNAEVYRDPTGRGRATYGALILLPNGRLQCYMLNIAGLRDAIQMNYSDDGGYSWSIPHPIVRWGQSPWTALGRDHAWPGSRRAGPRYRSPWPLQLRDGRIIVVFARRQPPFGIGLVASEDAGKSWSTETVIRADGSDWDLGYPVATELDDGRVFCAYYFMKVDGNNLGGTRHIASSIFHLA